MESTTCLSAGSLTFRKVTLHDKEREIQKTGHSEEGLQLSTKISLCMRCEHNQIIYHSLLRILNNNNSSSRSRKL